MEVETVSITFDNTVADHLAAERLYYKSSPFANLDRVLEDDRLWLLVYGTQMYTVVPKRAFTGEGDLARFRSLVADCIAVRKSGAG